MKRKAQCVICGGQSVRFKEGAKVNLMGAENLPENLDVSYCDKVDLFWCSLSQVKCLTFKNRKQMEVSGAQLPKDWKGKLVFTDEQQEPPVLGLAFVAKTHGGR